MRRFALVPSVLAIVILFGVSLIVFFAGQNVQQIQTLLNDSGAVIHTLEVQRQLDDVLLTIAEAETSQQAFLLTGDESRLEPYQTAGAHLTNQFRQLHALALDNPAQVARVEQLRETTTRQLAEMTEAIDARRGRGSDHPTSGLEEAGQRFVTEIREIIAEMAAEEATLLAARQAQAQAAYEAAVAGRFGSSVVSGLLFVILAVFAAAWVQARERSARAKAEERERRYLEDTRREEVARTEAEKANRSKDEFLAVLSHELRTPLNAVLGWAQILQEKTPQDAALIKGLASIKRNAEAQQRLVEDRLDVSSIVAGKFPMERRAIDVRTPVGAAVDAIRPAAEAKGVELQAHLNGAVLVHADPYRIEQVATNLLSNAVKFTPAGGRIEASLAAANGAVVLSVRVTGEGLSPELVPRIFDRFRQGDGTTTRAHGGLGLGLAIVKHIVDAHGGTIEAWSDGEGCGATFLVRLPVAMSAGEPS